MVSGASRGLGYAVARALHAEGATVILAARDGGPLEEAADRLGDGRAVPVAVDLADPTAPEMLADAALSHTGRLDGGVCNTGGPAPGSAIEMDEALWRGAFESAFLGPLRLARHLAGRMDGGALLFILSTSVKAPIVGLDTSNGLRPGLAMLVKSLADQLGPRDVRVNAVLPGRFSTARSLQIDQASADPAAARARNEAAIPLRRYGDPDELGRVGAFLLSPAASYLTGVSLPVDGGMTRAL